MFPFWVVKSNVKQQAMVITLNINWKMNYFKYISAIIEMNQYLDVKTTNLVIKYIRNAFKAI